MDSRYDYNLRLLGVLEQMVADFPEWRFNQILQNIGVTVLPPKDQFYEESAETWKRVADCTLIDKE